MGILESHYLPALTETQSFVSLVSLWLKFHDFPAINGIAQAPSTQIGDAQAHCPLRWRART